MKTLLFIFVVSVRIFSCLGQNDIMKTIISSYLRECYSESRLLNRNNLPPATLPVLLDLVRKIEDQELGDMRQISTAIVHIFRQDGIVYDPSATGTPNIVPFSPTGYQAYKNRLLLNKLIQNNILNFRDDLFMVAEDKCAIHHMLSSTVALENRGDEEWTCSRIRTSSNTSVQFRQFRKSEDIELFNLYAPKDIVSRQFTGLSNCPIEKGVVSTPWGEVSMGTVITGISAGLEEQKILVSDLVTVRPGFNDNAIIVNNRHAATLAGDIAEAAVRQGVSRSSITIGASGGWNTTTARRYYFLNRTENLELTDSEIRGGLDGIILSELVTSYVDRFPEFKLSQYIDMYYSYNGLLHEKRFRACNRKVLVPDVASSQILLEQTLGPAVALYHVSSLSGSTNLMGIQNFVNESVKAFHNYIPQYINDDVCLGTTDQVIRPKLNLILITEPTFTRSDIISYIADQIEVGKYGSSITFMDPSTGNIIVNKTFSLATFHEDFAKNVVSQSGGLNMLNILKSLTELVFSEMDKETASGYSGGNSTIALFLSNTIPLPDNYNDEAEAFHRADWLKRYIPDLRLVFATSAASETALSPMLRQIEDFVPISLTSISTSFIELRPLITTLVQTPRRIINPECGYRWNDITSGIVGFDGFLDADGINLYRIMPNYFYKSSNTRMIRVQSYVHGPINVCYSRTDMFPRRNRTSGVIPDNIQCESAANGEMVDISLSGACDKFPLITCPPLYLTVASMLIPSDPQCKDHGCRYPNDVKYSIAAHDLECSKAGFNIISKMLLLFCLIITFISPKI